MGHDDEKHATAMKQLARSCQTKIDCHIQRVATNRTIRIFEKSGEIHTKQLQDGNSSLREHVPRDQNLGNELIRNELRQIQSLSRDDVSMSEVNYSLCIGEELSQVSHTGKKLE